MSIRKEAWHNTQIPTARWNNEPQGMGTIYSVTANEFLLVLFIY